MRRAAETQIVYIWYIFNSYIYYIYKEDSELRRTLVELRWLLCCAQSWGSAKTMHWKPTPNHDMNWRHVFTNQLTTESIINYNLNWFEDKPMVEFIAIRVRLNSQLFSNHFVFCAQIVISSLKDGWLHSLSNR